MKKLLFALILATTSCSKDKEITQKEYFVDKVSGTYHVEHHSVIGSAYVSDIMLKPNMVCASIMSDTIAYSRWELKSTGAINADGDTLLDVLHISKICAEAYVEYSDGSTHRFNRSNYSIVGDFLIKKISRDTIYTKENEAGVNTYFIRVK